MQLVIFLTLLGKLVPLYVIVGVGYIAGRWLNVSKEQIASLLIYIIAPVVVFDGVFRADIGISLFALPFFFLLTSSLLCGIAYALGSYVWADATRNIFAFTAGTGNTGYFGLPVALALLGEDHMSAVVLAILGLIFYENTVGFFAVARGHHTVRESVARMVMLPAVYAFLFGIFANVVVLPLGENYASTALSFRGAYSVLGMMMVGLGLGGVQRVVWDWKFLSLTFLAKFVVWPLWVGLVLFIDRTLLQFFSPVEHEVMILMAIVPLAANTVAYASLLKAAPEKAALAVLLSTLFALVFIPVVVGVVML